MAKHIRYGSKTKKPAEDYKKPTETINKEESPITKGDKTAAVLLLIIAIMIGLFFLTGFIFPLVVAGVCFVSMFFLPGGKGNARRARVELEDDIANPSHPTYRMLYGDWSEKE